MAARQGPGNSPGIALHRQIKTRRIEIEIIDGHHLQGQTELRGGCLQPATKTGFAASRQGAESDQMM